MLTPVNNNRYISIKSDGRFHEKVNEGTEGAVLRKYELKDGTEGQKWELLYKDISNVYIKNVAFEDSDFGENVLVTLGDDEYEVVWAENTASNFGTDFLKKLPNIDFSKPVSIKPYAFEDENGKDKRGVGVYQSDKITDFFFDSETKTKLHGFPEWPKEDYKDMSKDDWKMYFLQVKMFLTDYTKKNIIPLFVAGVEIDTTYKYPENDNDPPEGESPF